MQIFVVTGDGTGTLTYPRYVNEERIPPIERNTTGATDTIIRNKQSS